MTPLIAFISTVSASSYCFLSESEPGIVLVSAKPNSRSTADKINRSAFSLPILGSSVSIILFLNFTRAPSSSGCRESLAPNFSRLCLNTLNTTFSSVSCSGTVLSVASPRPRLMTDMAMASAAGVRLDNSFVTVVLKLTTCLTSSGATAGFRGSALPLTAGCTGRAPTDPDVAAGADEPEIAGTPCTGLAILFGGTLCPAGPRGGPPGCMPAAGGGLDA
jgi:hypothetical protein